MLIGEDELSQEIYEIENATDSQRATLRRRVEANSFWETTGLRTQDAEWQKEDGGYWLYAHYTVTRAGETVGRRAALHHRSPTGCMWRWTGESRAGASPGGI